eukprot:CAMPEP_0114995494 /NCGR_PEP_ID=MMETSP0216-20121206/13763_1 /TAXON_ID=223996 /ORGANISM="Protocruzia adherens, Strain Boccale" /LENGTH=248 /DNA_ID=CAMNT_0002359547 /DNA_START=654 /DNA_END=1400 /DNA_ORIENTATION=+
MAQIRQGQALANQGQYGQALKAYEACIKLTTHDELIPALYNHMGACHLKTGNLEKSLAVLLDGLKLAEQNEELENDLYESFHLNIAHCKTQMEDYEGAVQSFTSALEYHEQRMKSNPEALSLLHYKIANLLHLTEDYPAALKHCDKALDLDPDNHRAFRLQGEIFFTKKNYRKSLRCFKQAISIISMAKRSRRLGAIYLQVGHVLEELNNFPEALKYYTKALQAGCKPREVKAKHPDLEVYLQKIKKS